MYVEDKTKKNNRCSQAELTNYREDIEPITKTRTHQLSRILKEEHTESNYKTFLLYYDYGLMSYELTDTEEDLTFTHVKIGELTWEYIKQETKRDNLLVAQEYLYEWVNDKLHGLEDDKIVIKQESLSQRSFKYNNELVTELKININTKGASSPGVSRLSQYIWT